MACSPVRHLLPHSLPYALFQGLAPHHIDLAQIPSLLRSRRGKPHPMVLLVRRRS